MEQADQLQIFKQAIRQRLDKYVSQTGVRFNPNVELVDQLITGLAARESKHARAYCPCRMPSGDKRQDAMMICPCFYSREELERDGMCLCKLFVVQP